MTTVHHCVLMVLLQKEVTNQLISDDRCTKEAAEGQLPAAQSVHQPHPQQGKHKVGAGGCSSQPDGLFIVPDAGHLQNGGTVVPEGGGRG